MNLKAKQIVSLNMHNVLTEGTTLVGNIKAGEDFRIDGIVEGNVSCDGKIVLGSKGAITGDIECSNAELSGKVQGTIRISGNLILKATAVYTGDVYTRTMEIESGAVFNGSCTMID